MASSGLRSVLVRSTKMPSNFLSSSTLSGIDREVIFADCLQVTAIAGVADQRLVALGELPLQRGEDRGAIGGILLRLLMVAARPASITVLAAKSACLPRLLIVN